MKIIKPKKGWDFSEAAVEQAMLDMRMYHHKDNFALTLTVSVFDVRVALDIMIDDKRFRDVRYVFVTPEFRESEFSVQDDFNEVVWKSPGA